MSDLDQLPLPAQADVATQEQQQASTQHHHHHQHQPQQQQLLLQQQEEEEEDTGDMTTPPPPPPPPPLEPFFTLVTNTTTASTIHPRVQYLFSDDDLSALVANQPSSSSLSSPSSTRPLIVDLVPTSDNTSWTVSWASSLSPDFALTSSCITVQPDNGGGGNGNDNENDIHKDSSTTLRLEGVERDPPDVSRPAGSLPSSGSGTALGREDVDALADEFRRRIAVLRKVVGEGEKRRLIIEEAQGQAQAPSQSASSPSPREQNQDQDHQPAPLDDQVHRPQRPEHENDDSPTTPQGQQESPTSNQGGSHAGDPQAG
ncbi:hypothetical protein E4U55_000127 [Claviceps digitariae]|nr:hypothetical protein E4U55_000127 [Claviceps digitariae]